MKGSFLTMSENPFTRRLAKHSIGRGGRHSEKRIAKSVGARQTAASGAVEGFKGDLSMKDFLAECKSTQNGSMSLKFDWLVKISKEARDTRRRPLMMISFTTEGGRAVPNGDWVMMPLALFKEIVEDA